MHPITKTCVCAAKLWNLLPANYHTALEPFKIAFIHRRRRWAKVNSDKFTKDWIQFLVPLPKVKRVHFLWREFCFIYRVTSSLITLLREPCSSEVPQRNWFQAMSSSLSTHLCSMKFLGSLAAYALSRL